MDTYSDYPSNFDLPTAGAGSADDISAEIGTDERRMHVRAYNYWVSLLGGRDFPSIEDLEPGEVADFAAHSVLLDFTCGRDNPALPYVGAAIRDECALGDDVRTISDVPGRSLLSRLTDHFMQIIANRAPVGFEAEFDNPHGEPICYRGILMPFSSDGDTIDFIYGVINWKHVADSSQRPGDQPATFEIAGIDDITGRAGDEDEALELTEVVEHSPAIIDIPNSSEPLELNDRLVPSLATPAQSASSLITSTVANVHVPWADGPLADAADDSEEGALAITGLDESAGLADRLWAARTGAEMVKAGEGRTRAALYGALSLAYDFAIAAEHSPDEYSELLEDAGVKAQSRAPMTPIVKLVFGIDYDKARLTEFAAALSYAKRQDVAVGSFEQFISTQAGGLKALVAAERNARRPEQGSAARSEAARSRLRAAPSISLSDIPEEQEFAVILTRRGSDGSHEAVAIVDDEALVERVIRRAA